MRILVVHCNYRFESGERVVADDEVRLLTNAGHDVETLFYENPDTPQGAMVALSQSLWNRRSAKKIEQKIAEFRPDIVHLHNQWFAASPSVAATVESLGVPLVVTLHNYRFDCIDGTLWRNNELCTDCVGTNPMFGIRHRCYRNSAALSAVAAASQLMDKRKRFDGRRHFIAPTQYVHDMAERSGIESASIRVIPHFRNDPGPRSSPPSQSNDVYYFGRLAEGKGLERLIVLWGNAHVGDLQLKIAGDGPLFDELSEHSAPFGNIEMLGWCEPDDVMDKLLSARGLVVSSEWPEPFGLVLVEGLSAGLGVVAYDVSSVKEILGDGALSVVEPGNDHLFVEALELFVDDERCDEVSQRARHRFETTFREQQHLELLEGVYELVSSRAR